MSIREPDPHWWGSSGIVAARLDDPGRQDYDYGGEHQGQRCCDGAGKIWSGLQDERQRSDDVGSKHGWYYRI